MGKQVFISYRRADSSGFAQALYGTLCRYLNPRDVFMDVDSIEPGSEFAAVIDRTVAAADVVLVLIGPAWLDARAADGRRLDDPRDFVRLEVEAALRQAGQVVPVLLDGARMPSAAELPPSLSALAGRNAVTLSHASFGLQVQHLMGFLFGRPRLGAGLAWLGAGLAAGAAATVALLREPSGAAWLALAAGLVALSAGLLTQAVRAFLPVGRLPRSTRRAVLVVPVVLALLGPGLGLALHTFPGDDALTLTLRVRGEAATAEAVRDGEVVLHLGPEDRRQRIGADGSVRFGGLPARLLGRRLAATPHVAGFVAEADTLPPLRRDAAFELVLRAQTYATTVRGTVVGPNQQPIPGVQLTFDAGLAVAQTDERGNFRVVVPVKPGTALAVRATRKGRVGFYDTVTIGDQVPLVLPFAPRDTP